ncbi:MAG TPA: arsinothricin resistance N-acetyltransferase ArsN1 family B [Dokdonella sp.]
MPKPLYRIADASDAAEICAIYAPYATDTVITFETEAPDTAEMRSRIAQIGRRYPWLVAERDSQVVGYAYASEYRSRKAYRWSVDVGVYLAPAAHRRGIGRRLYACLFELLRVQGYVNAYGIITLPNEASIGLHEAMGFQPIGTYRHVGYKHGTWLDVGWWHLALAAPPPLPPHKPAAFTALDPAIIRRVLTDHSLTG